MGAAGGKKTKPLITRVMGATSAPKVEVYNIKADIPRIVQRLDRSFSKDAWHYKENAKRKVPSRYFEGESDIVTCFPPMSFYTKLARSEIAKIIGSKRFIISWHGKKASCLQRWKNKIEEWLSYSKRLHDNY